jgi:uncharacterized membrane protein
MRPPSNVAWNLFLAVIPVILALVVFTGVQRERRIGKVHWAVWIPVLFVWFAFLPNTCYLITEWRHYLNDLMRSPEFYQASKHNPTFLFEFLATSAFYICYSGSGLICFYLSIYPLDVLFKPPWYVRPFFFFFCALGVYLGLVDRLNSWQIVNNPHGIFHAAHQAVERPILVALMCGLSLVLWVFYGIFGLTMEGARARYRQLRSA